MWQYLIVLAISCFDQNTKKNVEKKNVDLQTKEKKRKHASLKKSRFHFVVENNAQTQAHRHVRMAARRQAHMVPENPLKLLGTIDLLTFFLT